MNNEQNLVADLISITPKGCVLDFGFGGNSNSKNELMKLWKVKSAKEFVFALIDKGYLSNDLPEIKLPKQIRLIDIEILTLIAEGKKIRSYIHLTYPYALLTQYYEELLDNLNAKNDEMLILESLRFGLVKYSNDTCA